MQCKYTFPVDASMRLQATVPIEARGYIWEFGLEDGLVKELSVITPLTDESQWPSITEQTQGKVKASIDPRLVHLPFIQHELRSIQGLLCFFGLNSIDPESVKVEWLPESEEEKQKLKIFSFSKSKADVPPNEVPEVSFDLIARAVLTEPIPAEAEVPLNFYRRAREAMYEREFIQAIYGFFFIIETLYGNGKHKKAALIEQLSSSPELTEAIEIELASQPDIAPSEQRLIHQFNSTFKGMPVRQYLNHIVELRGFLHHHSLKRTGIWDANQQHDFELDCILLGQVTFRILFPIAWHHLDKPGVVDNYKRQISQHEGKVRK